MEANHVRSIDGSPDESHYQFRGRESDVYSLIQLASSLLLRRRQTVSFAESLTGGMLASLWVNEPGISEVFLGSLVAYADSTKETFLEIPEVFLQNFGPVSAEVAQAMAEGAWRRFNSDFSIALTGIAGPGGGTPSKPVGLVWLGIRTPTRSIVQHLDFFDYAAQRNLIREKACYAAMKVFVQILFEEKLPATELSPVFAADRPQVTV
jgi:nicotinamide-nucleotide amidase